MPPETKAVPASGMQERPVQQSVVDVQASPRAPRCGGAASGALPLLLPPELLPLDEAPPELPPLELVAPLLVPPSPVPAATHTLCTQTLGSMQSPVVRHDSPKWLECGTALLLVVLPPQA